MSLFCYDLLTLAYIGVDSPSWSGLTKGNRSEHHFKMITIVNHTALYQHQHSPRMILADIRVGAGVPAEYLLQ